MKKTSIFIILLIILISMSDSLRGNKYSDRHKQEVEKQKASDLQKRDAILKELNAFQKKLPSSDGVSFDLPIDANLVTGIIDLSGSEGNNFHYKGVIPPKIYGYATASTLNIRSESDSKSEIIGKLKFKEMVEILFQTEKIDVIDKMQSPWLLIRKDSGEEGWVFGAYVSHSIPAEEGSDSGKTDWGMIIPASGRISSKFGSRVDPVTKKLNAFHSGLDIAAPEGTPVYAAESGKVASADGKSAGYGNLIIVQHAADLVTYYAHLSQIGVSKGKDVKKGDLIGKVGKTGKVTGPHLHFEVRKGGQALNPEAYIK